MEADGGVCLCIRKTLLGRFVTDVLIRCCGVYCAVSPQLTAHGGAHGSVVISMDAFADEIQHLAYTHEYASGRRHHHKQGEDLLLCGARYEAVHCVRTRRQGALGETRHVEALVDVVEQVDETGVKACLENQTHLWEDWWGLLLFRFRITRGECLSCNDFSVYPSRGVLTTPYSSPWVVQTFRIFVLTKYVHHSPPRFLPGWAYLRWLVGWLFFSSRYLTCAATISDGQVAKMSCRAQRRTWEMGKMWS